MSINLTEEQVKNLLEWPLVCDAVEQSLRSVCEFRVNDEQPTSNQPARTFTRTKQGKLTKLLSWIVPIIKSSFVQLEIIHSKSN